MAEYSSGSDDGFTLVNKILSLAISLLTLVSVALGIWVAQETSDNKDLAKTADTAASESTDLRQQIDSLNSELAAARLERDALQAARASTAPAAAEPSEAVSQNAPEEQILGADIARAANDGNGWYENRQLQIDGTPFDQAVYMGWCSACFNSGTITGSIEYVLGRQYKTFSVTVGQSAGSRDTTGLFRFDIELDGLVARSYELRYGESAVLADYPVQGVLRLVLRVTRIGPDTVNATTAFGDPRVRA